MGIDMQRMLALLLFALAGCGGTSAPAIPPTAGDFIKTADGVGTAQVFGIHFTVSLKSGGATTDEMIAVNLTDPGQSSAKKRLTLGDDITLQLESVDRTDVRFQLNEQDFGTLHVGDKVVIDEDRTVVVNGTPRSPKSAE